MRPAIELRDRGRTLHGVIVQEGRAATGGRAEVFAPGSVEWPSGGIGILTRHRGSPEVRAIPERQDDGRITVSADATPAIREAVEGGRRFMSVEFHALAERTTAGGVREILRAMVPDVALVDEPEYDVTAAEVRQLGGFRNLLKSTVPTGKKMDCACPGGGCESIEFEAGAFDGLTEALATTGDMSRVVGNAALSPTRAGLGIEVDLLDVEAARDLVTLIGGGVSIFSRPLIDIEASDTIEDRRKGGTLRVRKAVFHAILLKPVARGVSGLAPARLLREEAENRRGRGRVEGRSALEGDSGRSGKRRRVWL